jgi:hypothetical protein
VESAVWKWYEDPWVVNIACGILVGVLFLWYGRNKGIFFLNRDPLLSLNKHAFSGVPAGTYDEVFSGIIEDHSFVAIRNLTKQGSQLEAVSSIVRSMDRFSYNGKVLFILIVLNSLEHLRKKGSHQSEENLVSIVADIAAHLNEATKLDVLNALASKDLRSFVEDAARRIQLNTLDRVMLYNEMQQKYELKYSYERGREQVSIHPGKEAPQSMDMTFTLSERESIEKLREYYEHGIDGEFKLNLDTFTTELSKVLDIPDGPWVAVISPTAEDRPASLNIHATSRSGKKEFLKLTGILVRGGSKSAQFKFELDTVPGLTLTLDLNQESKQLNMVPSFDKTSFLLGSRSRRFLDLFLALYDATRYAGFELMLEDNKLITVQQTSPHKDEDSVTFLALLLRTATVAEMLGQEIPFPEKISVEDQQLINQLYPYAAELKQSLNGFSANIEFDDLGDVLKNKHIWDDGTEIRRSVPAQEATLLGRTVTIPALHQTFGKVVMKTKRKTLLSQQRSGKIIKAKIGLRGKGEVQHTFTSNVTPTFVS